MKNLSLPCAETIAAMMKSAKVESKVPTFPVPLYFEEESLLSPPDFSTKLLLNFLLTKSRRQLRSWWRRR